MPLTDVKIRQTKATGKVQKLLDGRGLYVEVSADGTKKKWRYRYEIAGKENLFAIGDYPEVSLQAAREERERARALVKKGIHPAHERQQQVAK